MSDENKEGQKTIVSFIVGLLIGGLLVWAFSGPSVNAPTKTDDKGTQTGTTTNTDTEADNNTDAEEDIVIDEGKGGTPNPVVTLPVGDGKIDVTNQAAGSKVVLNAATYPVSEGWIGVRDYQNGQLGGLLGVARFSEEQGLVPSGIILQRSTVAGKEYAVVVYTESGDRKFNLAEDAQIDSVFATFTAQ